MNILLAIDSSPCSHSAVDSVLDRPWPAGTRFHLLSVIEPFHPEFAGWQPAYGPLAYEAQQEQLSATQDLVKHEAERLSEAFGAENVSFAVVEGFIKDRIIQAAQAWPAELIIMGTHGRHGFEKLLLGSISQAVMSSAPCSVEIVKSRKAS